MAHMKPLPKLILIGVGGVGLFMGAKHLMQTGVIPRPNLLKTVIPLKADIATAQVLSGGGSVKAVAAPSGMLARLSSLVVRIEIWAWNAQMGLIYAIGGPDTAVGSFMEKHNVNLHVRRQDDTSQMQTDLLTFATALNNGDPNPQVGTHFIVIMGDGAAQFFAALNPKLEKLGKEYHAEIVGAVGYSRGEDGFWGLPEWKSNPQAAKGALVAGVLRDGDWNDAVDWESRNNVPNNPDDKTYDPDAINWVNADTYTKAAEMYVQNFCEDLPLKAHPSQTKHVCVNGVVTWTPGDVTIAKKRGGLVPLLTTKQNVFQMPAVIIGIHKWNAAHRDTVKNLLAAAYEGADQVRSAGALDKASEFAYAIYKEESPAYWAKYYKGTVEEDAQGSRVPLGGSSVSNLADALQLFGLSGGVNILKSTYTTFGDIVRQQYPTLVPSYPPLEEVSDDSYLRELKNEGGSQSSPEAQPSYANAPMHEIVGKRSYQIQFRTGSADILPVSFNTLNEIAADVSMTNLAVAARGNTDSTGTPEGNMELSRARANAVKKYLDDKAALAAGRVRVFADGQDNPIASNATEAGRAQNRRVQIVLGTVN